ncbi:hypothetical protein EV421DRAFT_1732500 [Armillaria borealis]|uniref:Uncharacterized protein n=1 Tax=Armillaria borealis TaxID=47425 RepID=A0AA39JWP1_9AGAR|nr:hypothetical protein EV421DRAFT_1732500 [Armillaria borealis]
MSKMAFSMENEERLVLYTYLLSDELDEREAEKPTGYFISTSWPSRAVSGDVKEDTVELEPRLSGFTSYLVSSLRSSRLTNCARGDGLWRDRRTPGTEAVFLWKLQQCDGTNRKIWLNSTPKAKYNGLQFLAIKVTPSGRRDSLVDLSVCPRISHVNDMRSGRGNANVPRLLSFQWVFYQHFSKEGEARARLTRALYERRIILI